MRSFLTTVAVLATAGVAQVETSASAREPAFHGTVRSQSGAILRPTPTKGAARDGARANQHPFSKPFSKGPPSWR